MTSCILNMQVLALLGRCHSLRLHTSQLKNNNNNNNNLHHCLNLDLHYHLRLDLHHCLRLDLHHDLDLYLDFHAVECLSCSGTES